jgi:rhodanese-related sulfurtransferase
VALLLRRRGIERVRPLAGGYRAWRERGYPLVALATVSAGEIHA